MGFWVGGFGVFGGLGFGRTGGLGMNGLCGILAISHQGMNRTRGKRAIKRASPVIGNTKTCEILRCLQKNENDQKNSLFSTFLNDNMQIGKERLQKSMPEMNGSRNESIVRKKAWKKLRFDRKFICFRKIYQNRLRPASNLSSKSAKTRYCPSFLLLFGAPGSEKQCFLEPRGMACASIVRNLGHLPSGGDRR